MQHVAAKAIEDRKADIGAVLGWVDMHTKWPLAEGRVNDLNDGIGHGGGVRIGRHNGGKYFLHLFTKTGIWSRLIFGDARLVGRAARMCEVASAFGEGAGHKDGGLNAPPTQFPRIEHG